MYNLDVIISVGYRVKSGRGILLRKWASSILKQSIV
ncbi:MAG: RhuM family protein [Candidatus Enteromonas sp.]|nr:RhuM family protein [Candidatus Enteromonas sp.]